MGPRRLAAVHGRRPDVWQGPRVAPDVGSKPVARDIVVARRRPIPEALGPRLGRAAPPPCAGEREAGDEPPVADAARVGRAALGGAPVVAQRPPRPRRGVAARVAVDGRVSICSRGPRSTSAPLPPPEPPDAE